jgi:butyryl-CoA dehydrogenase
MPAIKQLMDEVLAGPVAREEREGVLQQEFAMLGSAKKLCLFAAGAATQKYMQQLSDQQEVMSAIADMIIEIFAMESAMLRAEKMSSKSIAEIPVAMAQIYASTAVEKIELAARRVIAAVAEGDMLRTQSAILRRLAKHEFTNTIALRRKVAEHVIGAGKYSL